MDRQHYNRLKAASKQEQSGACIGFAEREQARPSVRVVLAEKEKTGTWLSEQMGRNIIAKYLDVDVRELLVSTK